MRDPAGEAGSFGWPRVGTGDVVTVTAEGARRQIAHVPGTPSGIGFLPDGVPIVRLHA